MNASRSPSEAPTARMAPLARLPVFFGLQGKRAVVVGGSAAAAWKVELLSAAGASVDVYAAAFSDEMRELAVQPPAGAVKLIERAWQAVDLAGAAMAIGAFEDDVEAATFAEAARAAGVPVNVVDKPAFCDFSFGAIVNRSPLVIGVSTDGAAPVFAMALRAKLEAFLPRGFSAWTEAAQRWRDRLKALDLSFAARRRFWQAFTGRAVAQPNRAPADTDFDELVASVRAEGATVEAGSVTLVGAGPGDPELLTLRAVRALQSADVILLDDLVSSEVLDFARREAKKMLVGKTGHGPSCRQDEINALMLLFARGGKRVVRLKGGDPLIFGRADEEIAACQAAGISVDVVPGISAAQGAASRLKVSLTQRGVSRRVQFVTAHATNGELPDDIDWGIVADMRVVTAVYMGRKTIQSFFQTAVVHGLPSSTPAIAVLNATRSNETRVYATAETLAARLSESATRGPVIVLIGAALSAACRERRADIPARYEAELSQDSRAIS